MSERFLTWTMTNEAVRLPASFTAPVRGLREVGDGRICAGQSDSKIQVRGFHGAWNYLAARNASSDSRVILTCLIPATRRIFPRAQRR